jgi:predicted enzyme related to lactoylglutathione lyase
MKPDIYQIKEVEMLGNKDAVATIAVKDVDAAREFYEKKLGLKSEPSDEADVAICKSGKSVLFIYKSQFAGTNKATTVTWPVDDVDREVKTLKNQGIAFERYDFPGAVIENDVHVMGKTRAAWFKDPDGNILALVSH